MLTKMSYLFCYISISSYKILLETWHEKYWYCCETDEFSDLFLKTYYQIFVISENHTQNNFSWEKLASYELTHCLWEHCFLHIFLGFIFKIVLIFSQITLKRKNMMKVDQGNIWLRIMWTIPKNWSKYRL